MDLFIKKSLQRIRSQSFKRKVVFCENSLNANLINNLLVQVTSVVGVMAKSSLRLLDYKARLRFMRSRSYCEEGFYDPTTGSFISPDSMIGGNRYAYVGNNPVNFFDPSGHCPIPGICPWEPPYYITDHSGNPPITSPEMTSWLVTQMTGNAQSAVVQRIHQNLSYGGYYANGAMQAWTALVGTNAVWDFKVDILNAGYFVGNNHDIILGSMVINYDAVANMHFGFVGAAAGFSGLFLIEAAGLAQEMKWLGSHDLIDKGVCDFKSYCDHPFATWSIQFGIWLYDKYKENNNLLDEDSFKDSLEEYIEIYGEPPPPPSGAISASTGINTSNLKTWI